VMVSYRAATCRGVVLSKIDEAVKIGPALDASIRHKMRIVGVANGQRVPEDWHRLSAQALVQRALRAPSSPSWKLDAAEVSLVFAGASRPSPAARPALHA
jgi:flagellar biosynthesis protein FlhF